MVVSQAASTTAAPAALTTKPPDPVTTQSPTMPTLPTEKYENLVHENDTIGFLFKYGTVRVAKDIERLKFGLSITGVSNLDDLTDEMEKIQGELNKLGTIPAIVDKTDTKHRKDIGLIWGTIQTKIEILQTALNTLKEYQDQNVVDKEMPTCHLKLTPININLLRPLHDKIKMILSYTDLTATKQTYEQSKEKFSTLLNNIELIDEKVSEVLLMVRERIDILDSLASN